MASSILVLNGPNLNVLGKREPEIYGHETLEEIGTQCRRHGEALGLEIDFRQSNSEGELVDWIQNAANNYDGILLNAGGYTHTSVAILDALRASALPMVEVHLSNIFAREEFRRQSYISAAAKGMICGFGSHGYLLALDAMARLLVSND